MDRMKKKFLLIVGLLASIFSFSQGYLMSLDSARLSLQTAKGEKQFYAMRMKAPPKTVAM